MSKPGEAAAPSEEESEPTDERLPQRRTSDSSVTSDDGRDMSHTPRRPQTRRESSYILPSSMASKVGKVDGMVDPPDENEEKKGSSSNLMRKIKGVAFKNQKKPQRDSQSTLQVLETFMSLSQQNLMVKTEQVRLRWYDISFDDWTFMLKEDSPARVRWDLVVFAATIGVVFTVPARAAFRAAPSHFIQITNQWLWVELVVDSIFILDILVRFRTTRVAARLLGSRRRRGRDADVPWRQVAATPRSRR